MTYPVFVPFKWFMKYERNGLILNFFILLINIIKILIFDLDSVNLPDDNGGIFADTLSSRQIGTVWTERNAIKIVSLACLEEMGLSICF